MGSPYLEERLAGVQVLHATLGRVRIRPAVLTSNPADAPRWLERLRTVPGVTLVETNPVTRNVIVLFEPQHLSQLALFGHLESLFGGPVRIVRRAQPIVRGSDLPAHIARALLKSAMEAAVQRAVAALI